MTIYATFIFVLLSVLIPEWQVVSSSGPAPRYINQMVYANNGLLLFGGKNSTNKGFNDLWEWKDGKWKLLNSGSIKRWDHSYVFMENPDQLFLFGGRTFETIDGKEERVDLNDSWTYKNGHWQKLEMESPSPRSSHSLAFLPRKKQVVLFGGRNKEAVFGDTWIFDGKAWSQLEVEGPSQRYGHSLAYDPNSKLIYLFGGYDGQKLVNDMWVFDGEQWKEITAASKPSPRMAHALQFDHQGNAVLFGGWDDSNAVSGDLWLWSKGEWQLSNTEKMPPGRLSSAMGYDHSQEEFILFGGSTGFDGEFLSETWKLSLVNE